MNDLCHRCGKKGKYDGSLNLSYGRRATTFKCECGTIWYDQSVAMTVADVHLEKGRYEKHLEWEWHPVGTIVVIDEKPQWVHERFVCAICRREVGGVFGDVRSAQPSRQDWCLRCGVKAERAGAGVKGPGIAVWDERPYESTV